MATIAKIRAMTSKATKLYRNIEMIMYKRARCRVKNDGNEHISREKNRFSFVLFPRVRSVRFQRLLFVRNFISLRVR